LFARAFNRIAQYGKHQYPGRYDILRAIIGDTPMQTIAGWQNCKCLTPISILSLLVDYFKMRVEGDLAIIRELETEIARQVTEGAHRHPWQIARAAKLAKQIEQRKVAEGTADNKR
jgi:hypothetical protein